MHEPGTDPQPKSKQSNRNPKSESRPRARARWEQDQLQDGAQGQQQGGLQDQLQDESRYITYGQMNLINDFRTLWIDLVIWMRSYQVSAITDFSNLSEIANRLYRIPNVLNGKLHSYFGAEKSERVAHLTLMFIVNAIILVNAEINGDQNAANIATQHVYRYASEMADYLASINPFWSKNQWQDLLSRLANMGIQGVIAMLSEEYDTELHIRDRMLRLALIIGDYMASGIMYYLAPQSPS